MIPIYTVVGKSKLIQYLAKKFAELVGSEHFKLSSTNTSRTAEELTDELLAAFLPTQLPELLTESKKAHMQPNEINSSSRFEGDRAFLQRKDVYFDVNQVETDALFGRFVKSRNNGLSSLIGGKVPSPEPLNKNDYTVYNYWTYVIELPCSESHEIILNSFFGYNSSSPSITFEKMWMYKPGSLPVIYSNEKAGLVVIKLTWLLPVHPSKLGDDQMQAYLESAREALVYIKQAFRSAEKDFFAELARLREELLFQIRSSTDAERLRLQKLENEKSRYNEVLDKLTNLDF